ncbi:uncharacterized protein [Amphiura filiformis]|uniref:uncharacterized protein n=1 Tax=Amphiura filiformis TaxID=82378 RepID=UPI003B20C78D
MATAINRIKRSNLNYVKQIGEGGFSSVYQMTWIHPSLGPIEIAAKKLIKRVVRELDIMCGLDHPNIVKLLGVVDEQMDFMLILELCDKGSLRSYLQELKGKRLSDDQFYDWAEQAARPLEYLRQKCIIHKDVKSPNYMITIDNNLKLGDFGIAKNLDQTVNNATETASCRWMAPELLTQNILSPKYDIFAYGVVLWELRTGKYPFEGQESQVVTWEVCQLNKRLPIPEDCPQPIKDLMKRCWEGDWQRRPSIMEVITVIKAAAASVRSAAKEAIAAAPTPAAAAAAAPAISSTVTVAGTTAPATSSTVTLSATPATSSPVTAAASPVTPAATVAATTTSKKARRKHIITGPWELEREFGQDCPGNVSHARGIAANPSNGDVAVAYYLSSQVMIYTSNGEYKISMDTTQGLEPGETSRPFQVTFSSFCSTYFVTDGSKHVKCYDSIGTSKGHWVSSCPQASSRSPSYLRGLAMDQEGHLLVGDCNSMHINKHRQDGTYLSSIKVDIKPRYIAITSQVMIVVADYDKPPQIVSNTGQMMCTLKHPVDEYKWDPRGVFCYEDTILIANRTTDNILCYSVSGNYVGVIPLPGLSGPYGVALTADGMKVLVSDDSKVIKLYSL